MPSHEKDPSRNSDRVTAERRAAAIILSEGRRDRFAGLDLIERARLSSRKAGIRHIQIVEGFRPFEHAPGPAATDILVVLPDRTIAQSKAIAAIVRQMIPGEGTDGAVAVYEDGDPVEPLLVAVSAALVAEIRTAETVGEALVRLGPSRVKRVDLAPYFCRRIHDPREIPRLERAFLIHLNGGDTEGFFTRNIRVFSVPLTRRLLVWPITANQVTMAGFVFTVLAGYAFWMHGYWTDMLGALCYWTSMVLDCSDGEVARAKFGESDFGARLETMTDHFSYFAVPAGILWGDLRTEGVDHHTYAAIVALIISAAIISLVERMRSRLACANPTAFNETVTVALQQGTRVQQLTCWGRQFIKRSFVAHLILFQAFIGHMPALTEVWAYGGSVSLALLLAVQMHVLRTQGAGRRQRQTAPSLLET